MKPNVAAGLQIASQSLERQQEYNLSAKHHKRAF